MKKTKKILIGVSLGIGVLFIVPFLISTDTYLRKAERITADKLGVPVVITKGNISFLPSPRIVASSIVIGNSKEMVVEELVIVPTLSSLFSANKKIDLIITKPIIKKAALAFFSALSTKKSDSGETAAINIRQINIDEMQFVWPDAKLPTISAEILLTEANQLASAMIKSLDGKLKADIKPNGDAHLITVSADKWTLPAGMPLLIDKATFEMYLKGSKLTIPKMDVGLYGGKLSGDAVLSWQENKGVTHWKTSGHLNVDSLSIKEPSKMVSQSVYLSGRLFGGGNFSASAQTPSQLAQRLQANFKFKVNNGVLHGLDLVKVASLLVKQSQSGGETQFDAFSGLLNMSGKQYHLRDLKISSGLLMATGQVKVKPSKQLDGVIAVEVKRSIGLAAIPLSVSGTVDKPVLLPSKAALLGAAAGTAILGPGVGTSIGIKAAGALDSVKQLFGGDK